MKTKIDAAVRTAPYQIYNIGNGHPVPLMRYIQALEKHSAKKRSWNYCRCSQAMYGQLKPMSAVWCPISGIDRKIDVETGVARFVEWYCDYYGVQLSD